MHPAFDAIRGHKSAHSFATGPVIAEPKTKKLVLTSLLLLTITVFNPFAGEEPEMSFST